MIEHINDIAGMWWGWMWPMFWQISLLIVLISLVDLGIRRRVRPQIRYALWLLVLLGLVLPPGIIWPNTGPLIVADSTHQATVILSWQGYVLLGWLAGVLALSVWMLVSSRRLRRTHCGKPTSADLPQRFRQTLIRTARKLKLRQVPKVILSSRITCPAVFGIFRPMLLINISQLSRQEAEHVLLHELAHIKRGDLIIHSLAMLLQIIYWFNPLLWLVQRHLHHLRELCCDATVGRILRGSTCEYGRTILQTSPRLQAQPLGLGMGALGLFENANHLSIRLSWLNKNARAGRHTRQAGAQTNTCSQDKAESSI